MAHNKNYEMVYYALKILLLYIIIPFLLAGIIEIFRKIWYFNIPDKHPYFYIVALLFVLEFIILCIILYCSISYELLISYNDSNQ